MTSLSLGFGSDAMRIIEPALKAGRVIWCRDKLHDEFGA